MMNEIGVNLGSLGKVLRLDRTETAEDCDVDVGVDKDTSDEDCRKASRDLCEQCGAILSSAVTRLRHRCRKFK